MRLTYPRPAAFAPGASRVVAGVPQPDPELTDVVLEATTPRDGGRSALPPDRRRVGGGGPRGARARPPRARPRPAPVADRATSCDPSATPAARGRRGLLAPSARRARSGRGRVALGDMAGRIVIGTSSWADPGFVADWYPPGLPAQERLPWYAERFEGVEVNSTFYAVPARRTVERWAQATPGVHLRRQAPPAPVAPRRRLDALPPALRPRAETTPRGRVLLTPSLQDALADAVLEATAPLAEAGRLVDLPAAAHARRSTRATTRSTSSRRSSPGSRPVPVAVEVRHRGWLEPPRLEDTLGWLEDHGAVLVGVDGPRGSRAPTRRAAGRRGDAARRRLPARPRAQPRGLHARPRRRRALRLPLRRRRAARARRPGGGAGRAGGRGPRHAQHEPLRRRPGRRRAPARAARPGPAGARRDARGAPPRAEARLEAIAREVLGHVPCGFAICEEATHLVPGEGPADARVVLVGEAPGRREDATGRPFVGAAGQLLDLAARGGRPRRAARSSSRTSSRRARRATATRAPTRWPTTGPGSRPSSR